jgi:hypothetical protein
MRSHNFLISRTNLIIDLLNIINPGLEAWVSTSVLAPDVFLPLRRALKLLNAVIKEFNSIKMPAGVKTMGQVRLASFLASSALIWLQLALNLHGVLQQHYARIAPQISDIRTEMLEQAGLLQGLILSHLLLKSLVKIALWTFARTEVPTSDYQLLKPWVT